MTVIFTGETRINVKIKSDKELDINANGLETREKNCKKEEPQLRELRVEALDWCRWFVTGRILKKFVFINRIKKARSKQICKYKLNIDIFYS